MNRVERFRQRKRKRWAWTIVSIAFMAVVLIVVYFIQVQQPHWQERQAARTRVLAETDMVNIVSLERFVADTSMMVAIGTNTDGELMFVSVPEDRSVSLEVYGPQQAQTEWIDRKSAEDKVLADDPHATIVRTTAGIRNDEWVWEVYYKVRTDQGVRRHYKYYRISDGEWLETYTLSL